VNVKVEINNKQVSGLHYIITMTMLLIIFPHHSDAVIWRLAKINNSVLPLRGQCWTYTNFPISKRMCFRLVARWCEV